LPRARARRLRERGDAAESARRFAAAIPGATVEILEGAGHHPELEAPERVAAAIRELVTDARSAA